MPALTPVYRYRARLLYIHDGDTLDVEVDLGFRTHIRTPVRLLGLNAPELSTPEGRDALAWRTLGTTAGTSTAGGWPPCGTRQAAASTTTSSPVGTPCR